MINSLANVHDIGDVRELARRRLPKGLFDFIDRGTGQDVAVRRNIAAFERVQLVPRALVDVSQRSTACTLLGKEHSMPLAVAPTGAAGLVWFRGEIELARAAAAANVPFTLATRSMSSIESIASEAGGTLWFQLYPSRDAELSRSLLERAEKAGFEALIVTVDTPTVPSRTYNEKNGFSISFKPKRRFVGDMLLHPRWLAGVIGRYVGNGGLPRFENLPGRGSILKGAPPSTMLDGTVNWEMISRLRRQWPRKFLVKGILRPADAVKAVEHGADAVVVSNHGGRNLDSSPAPIEVMSSVVDAVGGRADVFVDSGVRCGGDIAKAIALGARGVLAGRATLYGAAAGGEAGAGLVLEILQRELNTTMGLLGCPSIGQLNKELLYQAD